MLIEITISLIVGWVVGIWTYVKLDRHIKEELKKFMGELQ